MAGSARDAASLEEGELGSQASLEEGECVVDDIQQVAQQEEQEKLTQESDNEQQVAQQEEQEKSVRNEVSETGVEKPAAVAAEGWLASFLDPAREDGDEDEKDVVAGDAGSAAAAAAAAAGRDTEVVGSAGAHGAQEEEDEAARKAVACGTAAPAAGAGVHALPAHTTDSLQATVPVAAAAAAGAGVHALPAHDTPSLQATSAAAAAAVAAPLQPQALQLPALREAPPTTCEAATSPVGVPRSHELRPLGQLQRHGAAITREAATSDMGVPCCHKTEADSCSTENSSSRGNSVHERPTTDACVGMELQGVRDVGSDAQACVSGDGNAEAQGADEEGWLLPEGMAMDDLLEAAEALLGVRSQSTAAGPHIAGAAAAAAAAVQDSDKSSSPGVPPPTPATPACVPSSSAARSSGLMPKGRLFELRTQAGVRGLHSSTTHLTRTFPTTETTEPAAESLLPGSPVQPPSPALPHLRLAASRGGPSTPMSQPPHTSAAENASDPELCTPQTPLLLPCTPAAAAAATAADCATPQLHMGGGTPLNLPSVRSRGRARHNEGVFDLSAVTRAGAGMDGAFAAQADADGQISGSDNSSRSTGAAARDAVTLPSRSMPTLVTAQGRGLGDDGDAAAGLGGLAAGETLEEGADAGAGPRSGVTRGMRASISSGHTRVGIASSSSKGNRRGLRGDASALSASISSRTALLAELRASSNSSNLSSSKEGAWLAQLRSSANAETGASSRQGSFSFAPGSLAAAAPPPPASMRRSGGNRGSAELLAELRGVQARRLTDGTMRASTEVSARGTGLESMHQLLASDTSLSALLQAQQAQHNTTGTARSTQRVPAVTVSTPSLLAGPHSESVPAFGSTSVQPLPPPAPNHLPSTPNPAAGAPHSLLHTKNAAHGASPLGASLPIPPPPPSPQALRVSQQQQQVQQQRALLQQLAEQRALVQTLAQQQAVTEEQQQERLRQQERLQELEEAQLQQEQQGTGDVLALAGTEMSCGDSSERQQLQPQQQARGGADGDRGRKGPPAPPPPPPPPGMVRVNPTQQQRLRLKMLHWDKMTRVGSGTVWSTIHEELPPSPSAALNFDTRELETLFGLMEQNMAPLRRLTSQQAKEIRFVEHSRAHNIAILLSGTHMSWEAFRCGLMAMDLPTLGADQLQGLLKFGVPLPEEANAIMLYLKGEHPAHLNVSDPSLLGLAESFYSCVSLRVPRLAGRLRALAFIKSFRDAADDVQALAELIISPSQALRTSAPFGMLLRQVLLVGNHLNQGTAKGSAKGFKLESLLRLADIKSSPGALEALWASHSAAHIAPAAARAPTNPPHVQPTAAYATASSSVGVHGATGGSATSAAAAGSTGQAHSGVDAKHGTGASSASGGLSEGSCCRSTDNCANSATSTASSASSVARLPAPPPHKVASGLGSGGAGGPPRASLLQYVVCTALRAHSSSNSKGSGSGSGALGTDGAAIAALPQQLAGVRAAAGIQVSGITALVAELQEGYALLQAEAADLRREGVTPSTAVIDSISSWRGQQEEEGEGAAQVELRRSLQAYLGVMEDFLVSAAPTISKELPDLEAALDAELQALCAYFGEEYDPKDPTRILCVVHQFLGDFTKAVEAAQHELPLSISAASSTSSSSVQQPSS